MQNTGFQLPSRRREGQRDLGACSLVAAGWAPETTLPTPNPSRLREGNLSPRQRRIPQPAPDAQRLPVLGDVMDA